MNFGGAYSVELIIGYNDAAQFKQRAESFIAACRIHNVFLDAKICMPAYDTVEFLLSFFPDDNIIGLDESIVSKIVDNIFNMLSEIMKSKLKEALIKIFAALKDKNASKTQIKNAFVRMVCSLSTYFIELLKNFDKSNYMFFEGELSKFDFITLNVLSILGVNGMVVCFSSNKPDFFIEPLFVITDGQYKAKPDFQLYVKKRTPAELNKNEWFKFSSHYDIDACINTLLQNNENRLQNEYKVLSLNITGVQDIKKYESAVNRFYISLKSNRRLFVIDTSFSNPTSIEVNNFDNLNNSSETIKEILYKYISLRETPFPRYVKEGIDYIVAKKHFDTNTQKNNFEKTIYIWLIRICDVLFLDKTSLDHIPVIIIWGSISDRIKDFLCCIENMPVDIIQFSPNKEPGFSAETQIIIDVGPANPAIIDFPYELKKLARYETVAFNAEQEIREILSSGVTTFYQIKQFKNLRPIVLKTTYEEIDIMWKEPAKFRPAFSTAGDVVTIPSIFAKINGVKDSVESYVAEIRAKVTADTLLIDKFPYMPQCTDPSALDFIKYVYFKDNIDIERIKSSNYYKYRLFSVDTQNITMGGIVDFLKNDWYDKKRANFDYYILECLLRLPHNVMQLIHNFNFTENIPKVIVFNATNTPCSAEDCILIMFLKSLGFDVVIYVPTGYRIIEEYIREDLFNNINIGPYHYNLSSEDINRKLSKNKKKLFKNSLFNYKNNI